MKTNDTSKTCRKCGGNGKPSKGIMNFHNIRTSDRSKEFETKVLDCIKCESCGHSWIPKSSSNQIYISVYTSGMTLLANKVARVLGENEKPFDACSELANDIAKENSLEWSNVLVQYYNHYTDETPCIALKVPNKPKETLSELLLNNSREWFDSLSKKEQEMYAGIEYNTIPSELNEAMIVSIYVREGYPKTKKSDRVTAIEWFNNKSSSGKTRLCDIYPEIVGQVRRYETLTGSEIEKIWRAETQSKNTKKLYTQEEVDEMLDKQAAQTANQVLKSNFIFKEFVDESDVFNLDNQAKFSVAELKKFSEEFASRVAKRGDSSNLVGFWSLCKELFYDKFKAKSYIKKRSFDENLFKAYIDKFSDEEKVKAFKMFKPQISDMLYNFADIVDESYRPYTSDNMNAYQAIPDFKTKEGIQ